MNRISIIKTYNYVLKEIETFENEIINGDLLVYDLKGWSNFKNKAFKLKHICMDFYSPFFSESITKNMDNKPLLYESMEYLYECIEQIEQNYFGNNLLDNLDVIMANIRVLCSNMRLNRRLSQMEVQTVINVKNNGVRVANMKDYYEKDYVIESSLTANFVKNTILQENMAEEVERAKVFIFGEQRKKIIS